MTTEAWRQRAEGRELCECGEWNEDHGDACLLCGELSHRGFTYTQDGSCAGGAPARIQVLCRDGSGEFRRARRPE